MEISKQERILYNVSLIDYELDIIYQSLRFLLPEVISNPEKKLSINNMIHRIELINPGIRS